MRTFAVFRTRNRIVIDKRTLIACICTVISSIIFGIVLCRFMQINPYMQNYASEYLYFVYNFRNASLLWPRLLCDLVYGYVFFLIAYCTKVRLLSLPLLFLRSMLCSVYAVLIISVSAFGGVLAAVIVYIPTSIVVIALNVFLIETVRFFNKRFAPFIPAIFAVLGILCQFLLLNIVFRVVIMV